MHSCIPAHNNYNIHKGNVNIRDTHQVENWSWSSSTQLACSQSQLLESPLSGPCDIGISVVVVAVVAVDWQCSWEGVARPAVVSCRWSWILNLWKTDVAFRRNQNHQIPRKTGIMRQLQEINGRNDTGNSIVEEWTLLFTPWRLLPPCCCCCWCSGRRWMLRGASNFDSTWSLGRRPWWDKDGDMDTRYPGFVMGTNVLVGLLLSLPFRIMDVVDVMDLSGASVLLTMSAV